MLFYTIQGPGFNLEIHQDQLRLIKKNWGFTFSKSSGISSWDISDLSSFEISVPKFLFFSGKISWKTFSGETGHFKFSTSPVMVKKIETYLQKRVIKNHQRQKNLKDQLKSQEFQAAA